MLEHVDSINWLHQVKCLLLDLRFGDVWVNQQVDNHFLFINSVKLRLQMIVYKKWTIYWTLHQNITFSCSTTWEYQYPCVIHLLLQTSEHQLINFLLFKEDITASRYHKEKVLCVIQTILKINFTLF